MLSGAKWLIAAHSAATRATQSAILSIVQN